MKRRGKIKQTADSLESCLLGAEGFAGDQSEEEILETVTVLIVLANELCDLMSFGVVWNAAGGVNHQLFGQALREQVAVVDEPGFKIGDVVDGGSVGQDAFGVDGDL